MPEASPSHHPATSTHAAVGAPATANAAASRLGFWTALAVAVVGVAYVAVVAALAATGEFVMPPSQPVQLFGGIATILIAPLLVVVFACLHQAAPSERKVYSLCALAFAIPFAAMVSINRYVQLTVVQQGLARGAADQLELILPYGSNSIMFSLEILGWSLFLSLAALLAAAVFAGPGIERWLRWLLVTYGVLGLASAVGLVAASPIAAVGFVAWGPVLDVIAALLAVWFRRRAQAER